MDLRTEREAIAAIVKTFPAEFSISWMTDRPKFRIDPLGSFFSDYSGFQLVVQIWSEDREEWLDYTRYSVEMLRGSVVDL